MVHKSKHILKETDLIISLIKERIYSHVAPLEAVGSVTSEPVAYSGRLQLEYRPYNIGEKWGNLFDCAWFHITGAVPSECMGKKLVLKIDLNGEGLLYDENGCPMRGITCVTSEYDRSLGLPGKRIVQLTDSCNGTEQVDLWIDAACNDLFGKFQGEGCIAELEICAVNDTARELYYDLVILKDLLCCFEKNSVQYFSILYTLENTTNIISEFTEEEYKGALVITKTALEKNAGDTYLNFTAVGHAHLDLAWLWPIRETIRKGARTFATQLEMLDRYPGYKFGASQAQLYAWIKEHYPKLYDKVKISAEKGDWELQGGTWVEPDTNIPSGESLVRQFLYGQSFYRNEFGQTMEILWLPDVFGYSGNLPQIMKKSNCNYFLTIKLSWNQINDFPYHTFNWQGIDGSSVLVHMPPEGTYGSACMPQSIKKAADNYQEKGLCSDALVLYGISDGGGGCGPEHLERVNRISNYPGLYPVKQGKAIDFFHKIEKVSDVYSTHKGELYFEMHYGTSTTQANTKKYNRKVEVLFHDVELFCSYASLLSGLCYPKAELRELWHEFLLYQFHDILPGSSIKRVYDECEVAYNRISQRLIEIKNEALNALYVNDQSAMINTLPWERRELVDGEWYRAASLGVAVKEESTDVAVPSIDESVMENELIKLTFNDNGDLASIFDKRIGKEILKSKEFGNKLTVFTDIGDAWDIALNYRKRKTDCFKPVSTECYLLGQSVVRETTYHYNKSTIKQLITIASGSSLIDFSTKVDWNEENKMLRAEFPIDIASDVVSCDIQFGNIKRPTTENNSHDYAQLELVAHKYIDQSQSDYGIALLNDCKYGYYAKNGIISLNLLRSQNYPGKGADIGKHEFKYALYPHLGDLYSSDVEEISYNYNYPLTVGKTPRMLEPLIMFDKSNIKIETVKMCENSDDFIVRVYETKGVPTKTTAHINKMFAQAVLTNMLEDDIAEFTLADCCTVMIFNPFEVHTVRLSQADCLK